MYVGFTGGSITGIDLYFYAGGRETFGSLPPEEADELAAAVERSRQ